jgi:hypothetical protein
MAQEKSKQIFLVQPKAHQFRFAEDKMVPTDPLCLVVFLGQCQPADKAVGVLDELKEKKRPKENKTAHFPVPCSCGSNYRHHCCKNRLYHQRDQHNSNECHNICHQDD